MAITRSRNSSARRTGQAQSQPSPGCRGIEDLTAAVRPHARSTAPLRHDGWRACRAARGAATAGDRSAHPVQFGARRRGHQVFPDWSRHSASRSRVPGCRGSIVCAWRAAASAPAKSPDCCNARASSDPPAGPGFSRSFCAGNSRGRLSGADTLHCRTRNSGSPGGFAFEHSYHRPVSAAGPRGYPPVRTRIL